MKSHLVKWDEKYRKQGLVIIDIDDGTEDTQKDLEDAVKKSGIKYAVAHDAEAKTIQKYGVKAFPSAYLIGTDGKVVWEGFPGRDPKKVEEAVQHELQKVAKDELDKIEKEK